MWSLVIALALIPMVVCVQNPVHFADAQFAQVVQDLARSEVDQHAARAFPHYVYSASVLEPIQILGQSLGPAHGRERASAVRSFDGPFLDGGVGGIIAPRVETVEEAREVVMAARFPPRGRHTMPLRFCSCIMQLHRLRIS